MAATNDKKLYIAVGILVALGGLLFFQRQQAAEERATITLEGRAAELPKIEIGEEQTKTIDKIVLKQPGGDAGKATEVVLHKAGDEDWKLVEPIAAKANTSNVKSLLDNLRTLKVSERIDGSKDSYPKYGVSEDKAVHAVFYAGDKPAHEFYFGESGSRGQMTRLAGRDGVFAIKGYSSYLYTRDLKGWRDMALLKFEQDKVVKISVENENGQFSFERAKAKADEEKPAWSGKHKKPKAPAAAAIKDFDPAKVDDLVRAYYSLNATDFAQDKTTADVGLAQPKATLTFTLDDGAERVLFVGDNSEGTSRWIQKKGETEIWSISSWAADWAVADAEKFSKKADDAAPSPPPQMPMGMPGMPGMPGME
jgi:hypothetical protein